MSYEYRRPDLEEALLAARSVDALEAAMRGVVGLFRETENPENFGRRMFCRGLDSAAPVVAERLGLRDIPLAKSNDSVCIIGTAFYEHGGHSKVAQDIARLAGPERTTVILTDIYRQMDHVTQMSPRKVSGLKSRATVLLNEPTLVAKTLELYNLLAALRPTRVFLLNHHFDLPALIALWPFRSVVEFLHHVDHQPGLGATLAWSAHVDLTWGCHLNCTAAGVPATYVGMTVGVAGAQGGGEVRGLRLPDKAPGALRIATCGSLVKYRGSAANTWTDYAVAALRDSAAELIHIGPADDRLRAEVAQSLEQAGIAQERYVFAGESLDLAGDLAANQVDLYLSSYPETGAKANLEAMAAGLAPIVPIDADALPLIQFGFPLETWVRIRDPSEISQALSSATALGERMRNDPSRVAAEFSRFVAFVASPG